MTSVLPARLKKTYLITVYIILIGLAMISLYYRDQIAQVFPAFSVFVPVLLFLLPGMALSYWVFPKEDFIERIPIAFVSSFSVLIIPGVVIMSLHLSLQLYIEIFTIISIISAAALLLRIVITSSEPTTELDDQRANYLLVITVLLLAFWLCMTSLKVPLIGDDWGGISFIRNFIEVDQINLYEPFHGTGYPPTSRSEFGVWGLDFALFSLLSGLDPITHYGYLRPLLCLIAVAAFYSFARQVFLNRNTALFVSGIWIISLLASMAWGDTGYDLVARINQDKFALRYIVLPIALYFFLRYFENRSYRDLIFWGLACWSAGGLHPIGPAFIGLPSLGFGLIHLGFERNKHTFSQLITAALVLCAGLILPVIQLLGVDENWLAFSLSNTDDPSYLVRLSMATRAERLWLLPDGDYLMHPSAILDPVLIIAAICVPLLLWRSHKNLAARLLSGMMVIIPLLIYVPFTGDIIGRLVTPWLMYRLLWPMSLAAVMIIGWAVNFGVDRIIFFISRTDISHRVYPLIPVSVLALLCLGFAAPIRRGWVYLEDVSRNPELAQCQEEAPLLTHLPEILEEDSLILADHDLNFCIPAFSFHAKVLEFRWTSTLSRFPTDKRDEALEQVLDMLSFSSANFVDENFESIIKRYDARYIIIEEEKLLNTQLKHLESWFELLAQEGRFILYGIKEERPQHPIITANTALENQNWETAALIYNDSLGKDIDTDILAHLGLSEGYLRQGQIDLAINELEIAASLSPEHGPVSCLLADTFVAAGLMDEAIPFYQEVIRRSPQNKFVIQRLGHIYRINNRYELAHSYFKLFADLMAPPGSARWYRVIAAEYATAGWYDEAINALQHSLEILPKQVEVEVSIGDINLLKGDLDQAREAYQRANVYNRWASNPYIRFGILDEIEGDPESAIDQYLHAIQLWPTYPSGYQLLGTLIYSKSGLDSALQVIQDLPGYKLQLPGPYLATGTLYANDNYYDQSIAELATAIERFPLDTSQLMLTQGWVNIVDGQYDIASELLGKTTVLAESLADEAAVGNGLIYTDQAKPELALGAYFQAVRLDPISENSHLALGEGYIYTAQTDKAIDEFQLAITIQPGILSSYIGLGNAYLSNGDVDHALDVFQQSVNKFPDQADGYLGLARAYQVSGNPDKAIQAYQNAEKIDLESQKIPTIQIELADLFQNIGEIENAMFQYLRTVESNPEDPRVQRAMGYYQLAQQQTDSAAEAFRAALENQPGDVASRVGLAQVLLTSGEFEQAFDQLITAVEVGESVGDAYLALGDEYWRRGNWQSAISSYLEAIKQDPKLVNAYIHVGGVFQQQGDWDSAHDYYLAAITAVPSSGAALTAFGTALVDQGELTTASEYFQRSIAVDPTFAEAYHSFSRLYRSLGQVDEAVAIHNSLLHNIPNSATGWLASSDYLRSSGQWDEAIIADTNAVAVEPGNAYTWISLGKSYQGLGRFQDAEGCFLKAVELEPGNLDGYLALGDLYNQIGYIEEAETTYKIAVKIDRSNTEAHIRLGDMYSSIGRDVEAEVAFTTAKEQSPAQENAYLKLGRFYLSREKVDQAQSLFEESLRVKPTLANAYVNLGDLSFQQGFWTEALDAYREATQVSPRNTNAWIALGEYYQSRGDFPEAANAFMKVLLIDAEDPAGHLGLAALYHAKGFSDQAHDALMAAVEASPGSLNAHIALGNWYRDRGDLQLAESSYREATAVRPTFVESYLALGSLYEDQGEFTTAEGFYQQAIDFGPADNGGYLALGRLFEKMGDGDIAENLYKQALGAAPSSPDGHIHLGSFYTDIGRWSQAQAEFETAVEIAPFDINSQIALGNWYTRIAGIIEIGEQFEFNNILSKSQFNPEVIIHELGTDDDYQAKAIAAFSRAVEISPTVLDLYITLARTYQYFGEFDMASDVYTQAISNTPDPSLAYAARADFYASNGLWEQASSDYETAWRESLHGLAIGLKLADHYARRGVPSQALLTLDQINDGQHSNAKIRIAEGNIHAANGNWTEAIQAFETAILNQDNAIDAYFGLAYIYEMLGDRERSLGHYESAVFRSPIEPEGYIKLGDALKSQGQYSEAKTNYEQALLINPGNPNAFLKLGQIRNSINLTDQDFVQLIQWVHTNPTSEGFRVLADISKMSGDWSTVKYWLARAILFDPFDQENWLALGDYFRTTPYLSLAQEAYNQALRINPVSPSALHSMGSVQEQLESVDTALETYQRVIEVDPAGIEGYISLSTLVYDTGDVDQTLNTLLDGIANAPTDFRGYQALGILHGDMGDQASAMDVLQQGLQVMPGSAELYVSIGNIYTDNVFESSRALDLAQSFERGAQHRVEEKELETQSAFTRREKKRTELVLISAVEEYVYFYNQLEAAERTYTQAFSDLDTAKINFYKAIELQPNNDAALVGLGKLSLISELPEDAVKYFLDATVVKPNAILPMVYLGYTYLDLDRYTEALNVFNNVVEIDPGNIFAQLGISNCIMEIKSLDISLALLSIEHGQFSWGPLVEDFRYDFLYNNVVINQE